MAWLKLNRSRLAASCGLAYSVKDLRQQRVAMTRKPSGIMLSFQRSRATRPVHRATRCISSFREFWAARREVGRQSSHPIATIWPPRLVLYTSATYAACGLAEKIMGPFYCPDDQKVYLDLSFFQEMQTELHACDFERCRLSTSSGVCDSPRNRTPRSELAGNHAQKCASFKGAWKRRRRETGYKFFSSCRPIVLLAFGRVKLKRKRRSTRAT